MARTSEEDYELRENVNVIVRIFNAHYANLAHGLDKEIVQEVGEKLLHVRNRYFSGSRIDIESDRPVLEAMARIPFSH